MRLRKAVTYAYPTSQRAEELGKPGYCIEETRLLEDGYWSTGNIIQGADVFESINDPDLLTLYKEFTDHEQSPWCKFRSNGIYTE